MSGWEIGPVHIRTVIFGREPVDYMIAGWVNGHFGLHYCAFIDPDDETVERGYVLTHLPSGFVVRQLHCGLGDAKRIADEIAADADWSFIDPQDPKGKAAGALAVAKAKKDYPAVVHSGSSHFMAGPLP